ncbi:hypothetical protein BD311DRAFT_314065 [Dichomitus squalens]|uniref:Uncharacterized protein n=1 Tax=Dichomitus squalens TaxID=114155 RepID=A0A4Q9MM34_9APHY|nr:hypothetical protein BD311DRAFT_314065 [Dichomitus squalens]
MVASGPHAFQVGKIHSRFPRTTADTSGRASLDFSVLGFNPVQSACGRVAEAQPRVSGAVYLPVREGWLHLSDAAVACAVWRYVGWNVVPLHWRSREGLLFLAALSSAAVNSVRADCKCGCDSMAKQDAMSGAREDVEEMGSVAGVVRRSQHCLCSHSALCTFTRPKVEAGVGAHFICFTFARSTSTESPTRRSPRERPPSTVD